MGVTKYGVSASCRDCIFRLFKEGATLGAGHQLGAARDSSRGRALQTLHPRDRLDATRGVVGLAAPSSVVWAGGFEPPDGGIKIRCLFYHLATP